jgi:hypothetical protein
MPKWSRVLDTALDPYELRARLFPGLLVLLPVTVYLALLHGAKNPLIVSLGSVLLACGGPYLLSSFVRIWGQRAQEKLFRRWGAKPTTVLLRHSDNQISPQTKQRYRKLVESNLGILLPSVDDEQNYPGEADNAYDAAADALRPLTSDQTAFPLVFKDLVAYGFNRNAYGSRWVGVSVSIGAIVATIANAGAMHLDPPYMTIADLGTAHVIVITAALNFIGLWCFHFTSATVQQSGFSYSKRLWESLEQLPKKLNSPGLKRTGAGTKKRTG